MQLHFSKTAQQVVDESRSGDQPIKATEVMTLVTHFKPHLDEIVAFIIFILYGNTMLPEVKHVCFDFCRDGSLYRGKTFEENLRDMILCIGVGGGPLDEHATITDRRKRNKCAAILAADYIGVGALPELQKILHWTCHSDLNYDDNPFVLANQVKEMHREGDPFEVIFEMARNNIESILNRQQRFFTLTKSEYSQKASNFSIEIDQRPYQVVSIESDDPHVSQFARSKFGCHAAITIQKNSKGSVQIIGNKFYKNMPFENIVAVIRITEASLAKKSLSKEWEELVRESKIQAVDNWHFACEHPALLNGSESHPDVPPTQLSLAQLRAIVRIALTPELFEKFLQSSGIRKA